MSEGGRERAERHLGEVGGGEIGLAAREVGSQLARVRGQRPHPPHLNSEHIRQSKPSIRQSKPAFGTYKTVKAIDKTVKAIDKTVKAIEFGSYKTVKAIGSKLPRVRGQRAHPPHLYGIKPPF